MRVKRSWWLVASKAFQRCLVAIKVALKLASTGEGIQFYMLENLVAPGHDSLVPEEMEHGRG